MAKRTATTRSAAATGGKAMTPKPRTPKAPPTEREDAADRASTQKFETAVDNLAFDGGYD